MVVVVVAILLLPLRLVTLALVAVLLGFDNAEEELTTVFGSEETTDAAHTVPFATFAIALAVDIAFALMTVLGNGLGLDIVVVVVVVIEGFLIITVPPAATLLGFTGAFFVVVVVTIVGVLLALTVWIGTDDFMTLVVGFCIVVLFAVVPVMR